MKIILEWDGDTRDLQTEIDEKGYGDDMEFIDSLIWLIDYGENHGTLMHNDIKMTKEE